MGQTHKSTQIEILHSMARHAEGTSFILMMEHYPGTPGNTYTSQYRDYSFHPRFNQPCQGGELRKYESTHPGRCTQPHTHKPGDLWHPFPEGTPSAVAFPMGGEDHPRTFLKDFFHKDSPFIRGFGSVGNVELLRNDKKQPYGFIIGVHDLRNVDPTVMVNMVWALRASDEMITKLRAEGLSIDEAILFCMLNQGSLAEIHQTYNYHFSSPFSVRRYFEQKPWDLSGGSYHDRTDYNRTYIQDLFRGDVKDGAINWLNTATNVSHELKLGTSISDLVKIFKTVIERALANEKEVVETPYVYRDSVGFEKPTPVMGTAELKVTMPAKAKAATKKAA